MIVTEKKRGEMKPMERFQELLRELFQFDCADLDFGIYRIMNYKRDVIERFIMEDLPKAIGEELDRGVLADQCEAARELNEVAVQIRETLPEHALDADGNLAEAYQEFPLGKRYLALKAKDARGRGREALKTSIFNYLYTFLSRYYQDGDFISKRRYSKRQRYAIPYNGEEVYLYWANNDQYYVKTAEYFHNYTFTSCGVMVHFKLQGTSVEQNNVKGDKRFFLPCAKEIAWDEKANQVVIPFEYRPLTEQEEITHGKKNQQDAIIAKAVTGITKRLKKADKALVALTTERHKNSDGESVSFLEHHLRQYTRRNTSDFFIHKDLKGFLSRELDFYLKNEVLNLDEMETAGEARAQGWFQITRAIKAVGSRIVDFLGQIECFQKMLWEKRKFIIETQYCVTVGNIDESFCPDIATCEPQWAEWKELFNIDEEETNLFSLAKKKKENRIAFLKAHPTLVLDTKHFDQDFVDGLLASFEDLDKSTDGLLIHSENWQALHLMMEKYRDKVKCIYIDPPYNTGSDDFIYKDQFQHSSWLSMMRMRLALARNHLVSDGCIFVNIDDHETSNLRILMDQVFSNENYVGTAVWKRTVSRPLSGGKILAAHDYVMAYQRTKAFDVKRLDVEDRDQYKNPENDPRGPYKLQKFERTMTGARPTMTYSIKTPAGPVKRTWSGPRETYDRLLADNRIVFSRSGLPYYRQFLAEMRGQLPSTWWQIEKAYNQNASFELQELFCDGRFETAKPIGLVNRILRISSDYDCIVMDFFAGSGTTGHAVMNLNREDGGKRRFVLVEMGEYFDTILLARVKKVMYAPEWKDGRPKRMATQEEAERSPRIVKYVCLESYEDALNNIEFENASGQQALKFEDYLLKYMLKWETRASETLLNVEKLARPFSYTLHIHADGQTRKRVADIPETFNYLLGIHVQTRQVYDDDGRRYLVYRGRIDHRQIVVVWRETEGWQKADLDRDKKFVAQHKLTDGADEVFVNGDSFIPNAKALEPVFKARMFAPVET
jgi:adenine-specific DNA-methyltransferase